MRTRKLIKEHEPRPVLFHKMQLNLMYYTNGHAGIFVKITKCTAYNLTNEGPRTVFSGARNLNSLYFVPIPEGSEVTLIQEDFLCLPK